MNSANINGVEVSETEYGLFIKLPNGANGWTFNKEEVVQLYILLHKIAYAQAPYEFRAPDYTSINVGPPPQ